MATIPFTIYRRRSPIKKRQNEADELFLFLSGLEEFVELEDVEFGGDPPDFVFRHKGNRIGVELTAVVPKKFGRGGYSRIAEFKTWNVERKQRPQPRHEFKWGEFTLRESLDALADQFKSKVSDASRWGNTYAERWLLMHLDSGSPFGCLVPSSRKDRRPGNEVDDYIAKTTYEVVSILRPPHPFTHVILFSGTILLAFPTGDANPYGLPTPSSAIIERGAKAPEKFLEWRTVLKSWVEHPLIGVDHTSTS
jgi:hypothetical protein